MNNAGKSNLQMVQANWEEIERKVREHHKKQLNSAEECAPESFRSKPLHSPLSAVFRKLYSILHRVWFLFLTEDL